MKSEYSHGSRLLRRLCLVCGLVGIAIVAGASSSAGQSPQSAQDILAQPGADPPTDAFTTTVKYVEQFYPLWFTYNQSRLSTQMGTHSNLTGPDRVSAIFHFIVAVNDDTLYAASFPDLTAEPTVVTIPATTLTYSILTTDRYGDIFETAIHPQTPGVYALSGPGFSGTFPDGVTPIAMPVKFPIFIIRTDKFSSTGQNQISEAKAFRASLKMQTLSDYKNDPSGGSARILPELFFAIPVKTIADRLITRHPIKFLQQLQEAVAAPPTPPLSPPEQDLSNHFDTLFGATDAQLSEFRSGARKAYNLILERYLTHTGPTNWIHFTNIGAWGEHVIARSSITEFLQLGNGISTAAYYHAFKDDSGQPLDGSNPDGYVLTFAPGQIPRAKRFWSITAYTPNAIELVRNPAQKYVVASYTPGLRTNPDGSLSVYLATQLPEDAPMANWLPVPPGPFNIMLRVYGPQGKVAKNTYVPPGIQKR